MAELEHVRVALLATDGVEAVELTDPLQALRQAGASVKVISDHGGRIQAFHHLDKVGVFPVDMTLDQADPSRYHALLLPGGALNADKLRGISQAQSFVRAMAHAGKPVAAICHAPWELISAGVARDRTLTSCHTIQDDLRNAGARWVDQEVVVDGNLVTSRQPSDLPAFDREMLKLLAQRPPAALR